MNWNKIAGIAFVAVTGCIYIMLALPETPEQLAAKQARLQLSEQEMTAKSECQAAVIRQAKYGSKASFGWGANAQQVSGRPGLWIVCGNVDLMNGFGAMIPHKYACDVVNGKVGDVEVVE